MQEFKAAAKSSFVAMTSLAAAIKSAATNLTPAQLKEIRRQKAATPKGPRIPKRSRVFVGGVDPGACALVLSLCVDAVTLTPHTRLYLCAGEETRTTNDHAAPTGTRGAMRSVDDLIDANSRTLRLTAASLMVTTSPSPRLRRARRRNEVQQRNEMRARHGRVAQPSARRGNRLLRCSRNNRRQLSSQSTTRHGPQRACDCSSRRMCCMSPCLD